MGRNNLKDDLKVRKIRFDEEVESEEEEGVEDELDVKIIELLKDGLEDFKLQLLKFFRLVEKVEERLERIEKKQEELEETVKSLKGLKD